MSTTRAIFTHPQDNALGDAYSGTAPTVAVGTGTLASGYALTALGDLNPANAVRFTGYSGITIEITFGADTSIYLAALVHTNFDAGLEVRVQSKHAGGDAWGSSVDVTIPCFAADGAGYRPYAWRDMTSSPGADKYWRLNVVGTNSKPITIGDLLLSTAPLRRLAENYDWGYGVKTARAGRATLETRLGIRSVVSAVGRRRTLSAKISAKDAGFALIKAWDAACGGPDQPCLLIPTPSGVVMSTEANDAWLVRFDEDLSYSPIFTNDTDVPVAWTELARGRPWTT